MKTEEELIWESYTKNNIKTLYHGSRSKGGFTEDNDKGMWFVEDINSPILDYYSTRSKEKIIFKCKINLSNILDLSMYNADTMVDEAEADDFLIDTVEHRSDKWIDYFFYEDFETDYNDMGDPVLPISSILNHLIEYEPLLKTKYDSICILEGGDETTFCIFSKNNILDCNLIQI